MDIDPNAIFLMAAIKKSLSQGLGGPHHSVFKIHV